MPQFRLLLRRTDVSLLALGLGFAVCGMRADTASPSATVRSEIVLKIGSASISRYAVDKNLTRLHRTGDGDNAASAATSRMELYLARQVMIAEALKQGYADRPEVIRVVEAMERQILAQSEGTPVPPSPAEVRSAYDQTPAPRGRPKPSFEEVRPALEQALLQRRRLELNQSIRARALQTADLALVPETSEELIRRLHPEPPITNDIPRESIASFAEAPLATYHRSGETITLSVESWRNRFNTLFVRALPADTTQLRANIEDLVVTEYACNEARRHGTDRESRFVEDRRNFLYYQALDLFEKEQLRPRIAVTSEEMEVYYHAHPSDFTRPARAHGKLLHFPDSATASAWLRMGPQAPGGTEEETEVSRESPIPGAASATEHILRAPAGRPIGPIRTTPGVVVFLKRSTETEQLPYSAVADAIRAKLVQPRLETLEIKLAHDWAPRYSIEDNLHPEEFSILAPIKKPWAGMK